MSSGAGVTISALLSVFTIVGFEFEYFGCLLVMEVLGNWISYQYSLQIILKVYDI